MEKKFSFISAAPAYQQNYQVPVASHSYAAPQVQTYSAPQVQTYSAPSSHSFSSPSGKNVSSFFYHLSNLFLLPCPVVAAAPAATSLLGVKYSPSTSVSHMTYSAPLIQYGMKIITRISTNF